MIVTWISITESFFLIGHHKLLLDESTSAIQSNLIFSQTFTIVHHVILSSLQLFLHEACQTSKFIWFLSSPQF